MRTNQEELELLLDKLEEQREKAKRHFLDERALAYDVAVQMIKGRLAEISPMQAAERRIEDMKHPTKVDLEDMVHLHLSGDSRLKVGRLTHEEAQIHRGVPSWVVKMIRFIFFLTLAFCAWVLLIEWLAGDGGTSVTGRIVAATAG